MGRYHTAEQNREALRRHRAKCLAMGVCRECGEPAKREKLRCERCTRERA